MNHNVERCVFAFDSDSAAWLMICFVAATYLMILMDYLDFIQSN